MYKSILIVLILTAFQANAQKIRTLVNEGNEAYEKEEYENSLNKYQDALLEDALNEQATFNKGDALYKLKKYEDAVKEFEKLAGSKDIKLAAKSAYNIGNCYYQTDKLQESINSYVKSLDLDPTDKEAKHNLELTRAKLKEQSKKQKQNPDQQNKQDKKDQQQSGDDKKDQNGEENQQQDDQSQQNNQDEQENQDQQNQQDEQESENKDDTNEENQDTKDQQEEKQEENSDQTQQQQPLSEEDLKKMNPDDARKILDALREEEQKSQENKPPIKVRGQRGGKDW